MTIDPSAKIHPTAIIEDGGVVGANCNIGPYCVIGSEVTLGKGVEIKSNAAVAGWTDIGDETVIFPFASVGHAPQDLKYAGERTKLEIGARNRIREGATLNPGTATGGALTKVGDNNLFMMNAHVGHDCIIGSNNVIANNVGIGGHVIIGDNVIIGATAGIHQFCRIGNGAMLGGFAAVDRDVVPFATVMGNRATVEGLNLVGLKRRGHEKPHINALRAAFKDVFYGSDGTLRDRATAALATYPDQPLVTEMMQFILADNSRHICTPKDS